MSCTFFYLLRNAWPVSAYVDACNWYSWLFWMCVCPPDSKYSVFYSILCILMFMCYTVCYFTDIFHAVVRQISMLFTDNKDSVFYSILCILIFMCYTVCYFTDIFHAVVRQISMLFTDNKDSVFCTASCLMKLSLVWRWKWRCTCIVALSAPLSAWMLSVVAHPYPAQHEQDMLH